MAWWTHILFFGPKSEDHKEAPEKTGRLISLRESLRKYREEHIVDILYVVLSFFTYVYIAVSAIAFFFESYLPKTFPEIIELFSEPYLGVLAVYVVVKEIERRRGKVKQRTWGELFAVIWFVFFIAATTLTYYSEEYKVSAVYKTIVTNSIAALIIRLGTIVR